MRSSQALSTPPAALPAVRPGQPPALALLARLSGPLGRAVRRARDLPAPGSGCRPTGLAPLDRILGGGLRPGTLTELVGRRSSGRLAAVLATLAATTQGGEAAALVDLGDGLDPRLAEAAGIDLARLLWARPQRVKDALAAAEHLLAGGFPLVVLDLGLPPVPGGRGAEAAWLRLARLAAVHRGTFLVTSPYRATGTAAEAVVALRGGRAAWRGSAACPLLVRLAGEVALEKRRGETGGAREPLALRVAEAEGEHEGRPYPQLGAEARVAARGNTPVMPRDAGSPPPRAAGTTIDEPTREPAEALVAEAGRRRHGRRSRDRWHIAPRPALGSVPPPVLADVAAAPSAVDAR